MKTQETIRSNFYTTLPVVRWESPDGYSHWIDYVESCGWAGFRIGYQKPGSYTSGLNHFARLTPAQAETARHLAASAAVAPLLDYLAECGCQAEDGFWDELEAATRRYVEHRQCS